MAFTKKKQFKFDVNLTVEELSSVPFVNAVVFCKIRFVSSGKKLIGQTTGEELNQHRVVWNKNFQFPCKMTANSTTMELEPTFCRISIRRELKGGKAYQKIGFVDLNLAEYAGSGSTSRRFLLEGYNSSSRLDNSILKLNINLVLIVGDPCFKVPKSTKFSNAESQENVYLGGTMSSLHLLPDNNSIRSIMVTSSSMAASSDRTIASSLKDTADSQSIATISSCRLTGQHQSCDSSSVSSSSTLLQSRSNSENAINKKCAVNRNSANFSFASMPRAAAHVKERRTDVSRVDADQVVDDIIRATDFNLDSYNEAGGLQLIVKRDGTTILGSMPGADPSATLITINSS